MSSSSHRSSYVVPFPPSPPSQEVEKLSHDVSELGLNVAVFGEWYNVETMVSMRFFDDNTRSWWTPATGGCGVEVWRGWHQRMRQRCRFQRSLLAGEFTA